MIKEFKGKGRPVFFPVRWANAVARWILGLYSPKGTMVIHNTPNPGAETSVGIDVNIGAVAEAVRRRGLSKEQRRDAREVVRNAIDGTSIVWRDNAASVSPEWAESHMGGGGADLSGVGASKIVGTDVNSEPVAAASLLTSNPSVDKVLSVKSGGTAISWEDADRPAENPSSTARLDETFPSPTTISDSGTWTAGGTDGYVETVIMNIKWTGTYLYGYYRTKKYDRFGRLYYVSTLKRFTIDQPTVITWS